MKPRLLFCLLILWGVFWGCISCGSKSTKPKALFHVVALKGPSAMGMIQLIDRPDSLCHIDIRDEPMQARKGILDGSVDFAILPMNMAAVLYNKGLDYALAAVPVSGTLYLVGSQAEGENANVAEGENAPMDAWEALRGRRVHVMAKGMTPDVLFRYLLQHHGLVPDQDVFLDYSFPTHLDLAHAMAAGRASLGVLSEPYVSLVVAKNNALQPVIDLNRAWEEATSVPIAETAFMVKKKLLREKPEQVEAVLAAYAASSAWVVAHPDSAAVLIAKHGIVPDAQVAKSAISASTLHFRRAKTYKDQIEAYLRIVFTMNPQLIGDRMPDEAFYQ